MVGYLRYSSKEAYEQLLKVYRLANAYQNFFQPMQKLVAKTRDGARETKYYDEAKTPYQRVLASGVLDAGEAAALTARYRKLNPVRLRFELEQEIRKLHALADRRPAPSVTAIVSQSAEAAG